MTTEQLAEAMYRARFSDPYAEQIDRDWPKVKGYMLYQAERVEQLLREETDDS